MAGEQVSILDKAADSVAKTYAAVGGEPAAVINPATVTTIISIIMSILSGCANKGGTTTGGGVKNMAANPIMLTRLRVRRAVANTLSQQFGFGAYATHGGDRIERTILTAGAAADPADLDQLIQAAVNE